MLPRLDQVSPTHGRYVAFLEALRARGFKGDICADYANRIVQATDNSIYQLLQSGDLSGRD